MNDAPLNFILSQDVSRELRRKRAEREHPDGLNRHEIREALGMASSLKMQMQSLISHVRKPKSPAPASRAYSEPVASCSPQV